MIDVEVIYREEVEVAASVEQAMELLSDVKRSGMHFPGLVNLDRVSGERWRWQMKEKGFGPLKVRAVYEAVYEADAEAGTVKWEPPAGGGGDMDSYGQWTVTTGARGGARLRFDARTIAHIDAPRLMKKTVEGFSRNELTTLKRGYVDAITKTLGGRRS